MIKVQGLSKIYGEHIAGDDISFEAKEGHIEIKNQKRFLTGDFS